MTSSAAAPHRPFRRYVATLLLAVAGILVPVGMLNVVADPLGQFGLVSVPALDGYRPDVDSRTYKAEVLLGSDWDVAIIGNSVAEVGIDPESPEWKGARVFNASLSGANMYELRHVVNSIADRHNVKRLFLVAHAGEWNDIHTTRHEFDKSLFNPKLSRPDHLFEGLFGLFATKSSLLSLPLRHRGEVLFTPLGLRTSVSMVKAAQGHRFLFDDRSSLALSAPNRTRILAPSRLEIFREVLDTCRANGIDVVVVIPPMHAVALEIFFLTDRFPAYEDLVRGIERTLAEEGAANPGKAPFPLWDFTGYNEYAMEPIPPTGDTTSRMRWWWEEDHLKKELGDLVLSRVNGAAEPAGFGELVTPGNLEEHLPKLRAGRAEYLRRHPEEIAHLEQLHASVLAAKAKP